MFVFMNLEETKSEHVYKVSEITGHIKLLLESSYPYIRVEGEISNFRPSSTGHYYFTLKDAEAVLSAVLFRNRIPQLTFKPQDGIRVIAGGQISVYPQRGSYQLICETLERSGEGDLLALLEERKRKLAAEGLFDLSRKKPLPLFPKKIVVITSPTGAALRDILQVLRRRNAGIDVVILPTAVQGEGADISIAAQIRRANLFNLGEVIIVGRGGGSLEDLLPFSSEVVVREIAQSRIPVISAVGHEIDTSLADLAADIRAPTPSAAAEMVSKGREELLHRIHTLESAIQQEMKYRLENIRLLLNQFRPENLERWIKSYLQPYYFRLDDAKERFLLEFQKRLDDAKHRLELATLQLQANSPFEVLKKGYSIVRDTVSGKILRAATDCSLGQTLSIQFYQGAADATVKKINPSQNF
ncbi:MAG: exodeoxyribonuclease VII large subunit [Spirochaetales bacterium]